MAERITIDRSEYDALLGRVAALEHELDARDADLLDEAAKEAAAGTRDYLPVEAMERILAGEHPLRVWREERGLTPRALADRAGIGRSYLVEIETRRKPGSVAAYRRLADALSLTVDDLLPPDAGDRAEH
ncbi:helix-turn-helix transcriptional regulator [Azospirillum halopraeferens]|uniref:helix-turn-helix transcriptional regulator n=1 Tax=Azospirillum halopraeferens TaxID=34010 RepID=UPI0004295877|nr:helix-turn-helix transcriptional regulator [Azospirillum halopraeferens]